MISSITCPICGTKFEYEYFTGLYGTEEEHQQCPTCNYSYHFEYGNYCEMVGDSCFIWGYSMEGPLKKQIEQQRLKAHESAKMDWALYRKKTSAHCP